MKWFYAVGKKPVGPFDKKEFLALVEKGEIKPTSLVWRSGMKAWKVLSEVDLPDEAEQKEAEEANESARPTEAETDESGRVAEEFVTEYERLDSEQKCPECGGYFPRDQMNQYGDDWLCKSCAPDHADKTEDAAISAGGMEYGGFFIRAGAKIIDIAILWAVGIALSIVIGVIVPVGPEPEESMVFAFILNFFQVIIAVSYTTYFLGKYAATPGKMACRLIVVTSEGKPLTYRRACGRYFAEILSSLIFCIGYLLAVFDDERRTLHDRIVGTRVIKNV